MSCGTGNKICGDPRCLCPATQPAEPQVRSSTGEADNMAPRQFDPSEERWMTYVIAEPCINTKDTACVEVCPVDCIHPRKDEATFEKETMLYIDPEVCIDCGACEPACPVAAIFPEDLVPEKWHQYTQINA